MGRGPFSADYKSVGHNDWCDRVGKKKDPVRLPSSPKDHPPGPCKTLADMTPEERVKVMKDLLGKSARHADELDRQLKRIFSRP